MSLCTGGWVGGRVETKGFMRFWDGNLCDVVVGGWCEFLSRTGECRTYGIVG